MPDKKKKGTTNKPWKVFERHIASKLGGKRIGPSGVDTNDVAHDVWAIECKYRKNIPFLLKEGLDQADKGDNRTPILFIREKGSPKDVVVMWGKDFFDWFGVKGE